MVRKGSGNGGGQLMGLLGIGLLSGIFGVARREEKRMQNKAAEANRKIVEDRMADFGKLDGYLFDEKLDYDTKRYLDAHFWDLEFAEKLEPLLQGIHYDGKQVDVPFFRVHMKETILYAYMLLEAQHGKVPKKIAQHGMPSVDVYDYERKLMWNFEHECMVAVDMELRKHGVEQMLFKPGIQGNLELTRPISEYSAPQKGIYYWNTGRAYIH